MPRGGVAPSSMKHLELGGQYEIHHDFAEIATGYLGLKKGDMVDVLYSEVSPYEGWLFGSTVDSKKGWFPVQAISKHRKAMLVGCEHFWESCRVRLRQDEHRTNPCSL